MSENTNLLPWKRRLNLVVVGKSGVGKSSFLNYAAGRDVFPTGTGQPVTQEYFNEVEVKSPFPGISFALFDTKGIENDNTEEWRRAIFDEIKRRDRSDNIYDWFHTIIYCIAAGDKRIEPFDIDAIRKLMRIGSVIVLFTKIDQVDDEQLRRLTDMVTVELGSRVQTYAVCNGAVTRRGVSKPSGLENVLRGSFLGLWAKAAKVLPQRAMFTSTLLTERFSVPADISNLLSVMAIGGIENRMFPDIYSMLRAQGIGNYLKNRRICHRRNIPAEYFEKMAELGNIKISADGDYVDISVNMSSDRVFYTPRALALNELRMHYYRKAIQAWSARWATAVDDFYTAIESGDTARRFRDYIDKNVIEILDFYNTLTHSDKRRLSQHRTDELLDDLPEAIGAKAYRSELVNTARRLTERIDMVDRKWIITEYRRRTIIWLFMALAALAPKARDIFRLYMTRVCESLETELQAYGEYFLRSDMPSKSDEKRLMKSLRALAEQGDTDAMLQRIARHLGVDHTENSDTADDTI